MDFNRLAIIKAAYESGRTYQSIADEYGLSKQRIQQIYKRSLKPRKIRIKDRKSSKRIKVHSVRIKTGRAASSLTPVGALIRIANYERKQRNRHVHSLLNTAISKGEIEKPGECEYCGATGRLEGHHADYNYPYDAIWFCNKHHHDAHKYCEVIQISV
jgi:hypothetical protein